VWRLSTPKKYVLLIELVALKSAVYFIRPSNVGRALVLVAAFIVALLLLFSAALFLMSDEDYRDALIFSADLFFDSRLDIDGAFALRLGHKIELKAENIRWSANDGPFNVSIGELHIEQNVDLSFKSQTLWIESLRVTDLHIEMTAKESDQAINAQTFSLPSVMLEKAALKNISLMYTAREQQQRGLKLRYLEITEDDLQSPVKIRAAGIIDKRALKFSGTFGSLAKLRGMRDDLDHSYPIAFHLSRDPANTDSALSDTKIITVDGSIRRLSSGGNLLELGLSVDLSEGLGVFRGGASPDNLGLLQGKLSLSNAAGPWHIKTIDLASDRTSLYQLAITGVVANLNQEADVELQSQLTVPSPSALGEVLGLNLNGYGAFSSSGVLKGNKNALNYQGNTTIGRIESEVILNASLKNDTPIIKGSLSIPHLYLADIGIEKPTLETVDAAASSRGDQANGNQREKWKVWKTLKRKLQKPGSKDKTYIFAREPLNFTKLQDIDIKLSIKIDKIAGTLYSIDQLNGELKLADGVLHIAPLQLVFEQGATQLEFKMDTRKTAEFSLQLQADNLILGQLIAQIESEVPVKGKANLLLDVSSKGHSAHALASNLSGSLRFELEEASIPSQYIEFLSVDVLGWVARKSRLKEVYTRLDCIMVDFDIQQGVASSQLLLAGGPNLFVNGAASVDLGEESIDMVLLPRQKKKLFSQMPPVKIKGPLTSPVVQALPKTAAATTLATTVLLPGVIIPQYVIKKFWKRGDNTASDCGQLAKQYRAQ